VPRPGAATGGGPGTAAFVEAIGRTPEADIRKGAPLR
jgi:hypothetical protein